MSIHFSPVGNSPLLLPSGQPAAGYKLYVYQATTSTKVAIYTDIAGSSEHTNPIVLGADGRPPSSIYLDSAQNYRFVYAHPEDSDPPTLQITPPVDNVAVVVSDTQVLASSWTVGSTPTFISSTQFSVPGDQTVTYHVGRRVRTFNSGGIIYGVITAVSFSSVTTVTVLNDSGVIDSGISAVHYSFLAATNSAWPGGKSNGIGTDFLGPVSIPVDKTFNLMPPSLILPYAGTSPPPSGWLLCNGADVSRTTYSNLFRAIGTSYGAGNTVSTFNVPTVADLQANIKYIIRSA